MLKKIKNLLVYFLVFTLLIACNSNKTNPSTSDVVTKEIEPKENRKKRKVTNTDEMVLIKGGKIRLGNNNFPNTSPEFDTVINDFYLDKNLVSVASFREFIENTGYATEADKFGNSGVFRIELQNWELVTGANWKYPFGHGNDKAKDDHPVSHISWNDAQAFARWADKRLPTEAEWEYAARNGENSENIFSWGNELVIDGKYMANVWQGDPTNNTVSDGYMYSSPIGTFGETKLGLTDMQGNLWQWCNDIYKPYQGNRLPYRVDNLVRVIRGGSFMYDERGAESYSVFGRGKNTTNTSLFNTGFRCARDK